MLHPLDFEWVFSLGFEQHGHCTVQKQDWALAALGMVESTEDDITI
jgi:hypothetical protein